MNITTESVSRTIRNYIDGQWIASAATQTLPVHNPADGQVIAHVPLSPKDEVDTAAQAAQRAYKQWRDVPAVNRIQPLFKLKTLFETHADMIAHAITTECGKTLAESHGELKRAIENIEVACGIPMLMQGDFSQDIARGIDEFMVRQPLGVCAAICPFNFPAMIPFWFLPYAVACGNTYIVKPSERVPMTMQLIFELIDQLELPPGVINMVNGGRQAVDTILEHPHVRGISFVGSTPVAQHVYATASAHGKRAQCQGGAKNPVVIMPDCDLDMTTRIIADSAFGCAGQRCLAASLAVTVGGTRKPFTDAIVEAATLKKVGNGLNPDVEMGPVISARSRDNLHKAITTASQGSADLLVDGRKPTIPQGEKGFFLKPTVIDNLALDHEVVSHELFGPVLGLLHFESLDDAIDSVNRFKYGNMACIFTTDGAAARKFRSQIEAGNVGVNIGVPAPMAFFPFSGWKQSFFGDLHGQARHAVEFFTQTKVVIERWPNTWSRQF
jgi:malonate-semialdehyde dehydrogenase (acetylating) / methylmalonate-semialdehyde dehydrogenase